MQLGSSIAVAVVQGGSYSSGSTPSLGTSICPAGEALKKKKLYIYIKYNVLIFDTFFFFLHGHRMGL